MSIAKIKIHVNSEKIVHERLKSRFDRKANCYLYELSNKSRLSAAVHQEILHQIRSGLSRGAICGSTTYNWEFE